MPRKNGPWTIEATERKFRNELIELNEDRVIKPDGSPGTYATVKLKDGVQVLAVDGEGGAYLAREFRYALGRADVETVGGGVDEGEELVEAARRELREELGIEAEEFTELGTLHLTTSLVDSRSTLFLARRLRFTEKEPDRSERIETVKLTFDEAVRRALDGRITHASSCVLILRARQHLQGG